MGVISNAQKVAAYDRMETEGMAKKAYMEGQKRGLLDGVKHGEMRAGQALTDFLGIHMPSAAVVSGNADQRAFDARGQGMAALGMNPNELQYAVAKTKEDYFQKNRPVYSNKVYAAY